MHHNRTHHDLGVGIGNVTTPAANVTFHRVAVGNAAHKVRAMPGSAVNFSFAIR